MVLCAGWVRNPLFKHLGRLLGRAFGDRFSVGRWCWRVCAGLARLQVCMFFCDVWSCGGALARLPRELFMGLRRRLGSEGIQGLLSGFHCWKEGATAISHDTLLGGVLRGCAVPLAVPGIDVLETSGSASGREDR